MQIQNFILELSKYESDHNSRWLIANANPSDDIQKSLDAINLTIRMIIEYLIHMFSAFIQN